MRSSSTHAQRFQLVALFLTLLALAAGTAVSRAQAPADSAESWMIRGEFDRAERAFTERWRRDTTDYRAALGAGRIALYANRLTDADRWLGRAIALAPDSAAPRALMGEALVRRDDFKAAREHYRIGKRALREQKMAGFEGRVPNVIEGPRESSLPFVITDPLPVVRASVNGRDSLFFLIDTGGGELVLDSLVAAQLGAQTFGTGMGMFAGGVAPVTDGRVDSVRLGDFTLRQVPVRIMKTGHFSLALGGQRVDGVIGTVMLYHFLATIDYPGQRLVLRRRSPEMRKQVTSEAVAAGVEGVPMWLAGDHFMFAWARVNGRPPVQLFVDTGLSGGGFVCSEADARTYGIDLSQATVGQGVGGAGPTQTKWFMVDSLSMGTVTARGIRGVVGMLAFRQSFGFDGGGIISHQFFRPYALTFDFDAMKLYLIPPRP